MAQKVDARTVKDWLSDKREIAFLDVSEPGQYAEGHPFFANPLPYSRLELDIERLVPNRGVRVVLTDHGDGIAARAARRVEAMGYTNLHVLEGGSEGWRRAGYTLFDGVNLPSKTFGELVELERHTPRITAPELVEMGKRGDNHVIIDGRTFAEYQRFSIPGGISCPNGELALRIQELVPDPKTTIVVNCAGRTRSIIGAQTLIDFGVKNRVVALENGTQGWFLAGLDVARGAERRYPQDIKLSAEQLAEKQARARAHAETHGAAFVDGETVAGWLGETGRTTYLLDVRTAEEFSADALPGFVHAPGGQLQQATDQWVGVRGARIVVADSEQVRAPMVAAWLRQLGHDAFVLALGAKTKRALEQSGAAAARKPAFQADNIRLREVSPQDLSALLWSGGGRAIDLRSSSDYRKAHVPGSVWSIRPRIETALSDPSLPVVLIADDPNVARIAALDLREAGVSDVALLRGGLRAWEQDGQKVNASSDAPADTERIDFIFHTHQRHDGNAEAARAYLAWEVDLVKRLDAQERGAYRL